jgi:hypothetical protein
MKILNKKSGSMFALFLLLAMAVSLVAPAVNAQSVLSTHAFVIFAPTPVGVGQTTSVLCWVDRPVRGASVGNDRRFHNYTVTITKPDNTTDVIVWETVWDTTSSAYSVYTPDQVGTFHCLFEFFGETVGSPLTTYLPSNATTTLEVTEAPIPEAWSSWPLPVEYWTRPIEDQNTWWFAISSNWLNSARDRDNGFVNSRFQPDGIAPNTPHIMWSAPLSRVLPAYEFTNSYPNNAFYENPLMANPIIMAGRLYYAMPNATHPAGSGYAVVDLRTGEEILRYTGESMPKWGYYPDYDHYNQHGISPVGGILFGGTANEWQGIHPGNPSGYGLMLEPWFSVTNVPSGPTVVSQSGHHLIAYVVNDGDAEDPDWRVRVWNSSRAISTNPSGTINGGSSSRLEVDVPVVSNTYEQIVLQEGTVPVAFMHANDVNRPFHNINGTLVCRNGTLPSISSRAPYTMFAISVFNQTINGKEYREGEIMWMKSYPAPASGGSTLRGPAAEGVFTYITKETGRVRAYDMYTGEQLWESQQLTNFTPFPYTAPSKSNGATTSIAYGKLFVTGNSGMVFCYDLYNGTLLWRYEAPIPYAAYSAGLVYYPMHIGAVADGKIYLGSAGSDLLYGAMVRCLDVEDGSEVWTMPGWGGVNSFAVSDGYMVYLNYYDLNIYVVGKGPSAVSVAGSPKVSVFGDTVTLMGTVTDVSLGSSIKGSGAVSDADMADWMAYQFMGEAMPEDAVGVEVILTVFDVNENTYEVGRTTSACDGSFSFDWDPEIPGEYLVTATFAGSESYYPSFAHTTVFVEEAPPAPPEATPTPAPMTDTYVLGSTVGIVVTLAVASLIIVLLIRRRR